MYANLMVKIGAEPEPVMAWKVETTPDGVRVHLDAQDGNGSYCEPAGTRDVPRGTHIEIAPCF